MRLHAPLLLSFSLAAAAPGQLLMGSDSASSGGLVVLDTASAERYPSGALSNMGIVGELAIDITTGVVYGSSTSLDALYTCDLATGQTTPVGSYGAGIRYMHGIDHDVVAGKLWGVAHPGNSLYSIDTGTGAATRIGPTGLDRFVNIAYDLTRDTLFAADTGTNSLWTIDRATGAASLVGPLGATKNPAGMTFDLVTGTLYLADNTKDSLYRVDPVTGAATLIGPTGSGNLIALVALHRPHFRRDRHGCGSIQIGFSGAPLLGGSITVTTSRVTGVAALGFGLNTAPTPLCTCTVGHDWAATVFTSTLALTIPNNPTLTGVPLGFQAADLNSSGAGCQAPALSLSDTLVFTIG